MILRRMIGFGHLDEVTFVSQDDIFRRQTWVGFLLTLSMLIDFSK
jgi:hypothetical protein